METGSLRVCRPSGANAAKLREKQRTVGGKQPAKRLRLNRGGRLPETSAPIAEAITGAMRG
ncbi:hypothetical protein EIKCOROL_00895 [Eikenella corrodens ATCC 23834]|uniref:Uncharacterized protein n=1 Tax=Eikenella corrodens ATCC 23834 TaxID=546274 RepID=C0DU64_EIKCO|nr:hypothetical protein EIKCOROL_00895 [Eikenella corrodens ATCC 23834]